MLHVWYRVLVAWFYMQAVFYAISVAFKYFVRAAFPEMTNIQNIDRAYGIDRTLKVLFILRKVAVRLFLRLLRAILHVSRTLAKNLLIGMRTVEIRVLKLEGDIVHRSKAIAQTILFRMRAIERHATIKLFLYLKRQPSRGAYLEYIEASFARGHVSQEVLFGAILLASAAGETDKASRFGRFLVDTRSYDVSSHQHIGAQCFLDGNYELAVEIWTRSADARERLIRERDLDRHNLRFLGPSWFLAIGHVAHLDIYFKQQILSGNEGRRLVPVIPAHITVPNRYLLDSWKPFLRNADERSVPAFDLQSVALLQDEFWSLRFGPGDTEMYSYAGARVQREWEAQGRAPLLSIPEADRERGWAELERLGVPRGSWFVCLHVREAGFHQAWHKAHPGTRNADVMTYLPAAQAIIDRGGYVIRVGDPTMRKLPGAPGLIDYAHSDAKSEFMDIFLCATCRFFIGTNSGLGLVPPIFGVPCALTNWSPIGLPQWYPADLFISKLIWSEEKGRVLSYEEMLLSPAGWSQFESFFEEHQLRVIDNTPEELKDLVEEMLERVEGKAHYSEEDLALIGRFEDVMAKHGSYRGSRIGYAYLRKHADLLGGVASVSGHSSRMGKWPA